MTGESGRDLLAAVAAHGLAGSSRTLPDEPLEHQAWARLLAGVRVQRLEGHLVSAVADGALAVTDAQREEAGTAHAEMMAWALRVERRMLEVAAWFDVAGIEFCVLKGPASAHLWYPDPAQRVFADLDLLVPADRLEEAVALVERHGGQRLEPERRPGWDRRFAKDAPVVADGIEVDLHRTLAPGPTGFRIDLAALFEDPLTFAVGGRKVAALAPEAQLLQACCHAALTRQPRLVPLRDVAQIALDGAAEFAATVQLAASWGAQAILARAVTAAWAAFRLGDRLPLSEWARAYRATARQRLELAFYAGPDTGPTVRALGALWGIRGTRAKAAYLRALAFPDRAYLAGRNTTHADWWRRGVRDLTIPHLEAHDG